ncbi:MAG: WD40 repeat domain-containing protein [Pseudomonadota bacterium]
MIRTLLITFLLALAAVPAFAGGEAGLNQVWSRMADINGEPGSVESAEFSPDSRYIVTGTKFDNTVRVFRTSDGHHLWEREVPQEIERCPAPTLWATLK